MQVLWVIPFLNMAKGKVGTQVVGWMSLQPERLCVLVGQGNPLALHPEIPAKELERCPIITMEEAEHTNWVKALSQLFGSHGCSLHYRVINDNTRFGGAFPLGKQGAAICTERLRISTKTWTSKPRVDLKLRTSTLWSTFSSSGGKIRKHPWCGKS